MSFQLNESKPNTARSVWTLHFVTKTITNLNSIFVFLNYWLMNISISLHKTVERFNRVFSVLRFRNGGKYCSIEKKLRGRKMEMIETMHGKMIGNSIHFLIKTCAFFLRTIENWCCAIYSEWKIERFCGNIHYLCT